MASIISLVTDFGFKDFYTGALKGALLKESPDALLVDICHEVSPFDTAEAAFVLRNAYRAFPNDTLHIICVNERMDTQARHLVVRHNEHVFIGPDNGLFSMAFDAEPELVYELERFRGEGKGYAFINPMLAQTAKFILGGGNVKDIGKPVYEIRKAMTLTPMVQDGLIRGSVIYIDSFGNAVVNITRPLFDKARRGRQFTLAYRRSERIQEIRNDYNEVPEGERLCIFNAQDYLEIAINKGMAGGKELEKRGLLGLHVGDTIQIDFT